MWILNIVCANEHRREKTRALHLIIELLQLPFQTLVPPETLDFFPSLPMRNANHILNQQSLYSLNILGEIQWHPFHLPLLIRDIVLFIPSYIDWAESFALVWGFKSRTRDSIGDFVRPSVRPSFHRFIIIESISVETRISECVAWREVVRPCPLVRDNIVPRVTWWGEKSACGGVVGR